MPLRLFLSGGHLYYITSNFATTKGPNISFQTLDFSSGKQIGFIRPRSDKIASADAILYFGEAVPLIIWTDKDFKTLNVNLIGFETVFSFNIHRKDDEQVKRIFVHASLATEAQVHFLVHYQSKASHYAEIYRADLSSPSVEKAYDLPPSSGLGVFSTSAQGANVFFTRITESGIDLFSSLRKDGLAHWPIRDRSLYGSSYPKMVSHAVSEVVTKGTEKYAVRCALVLSTGDWELILNGDHVWLRPESLAGAIAAAFIDPFEERGLADELAMESHSSLFTAYVHRIKRHLRVSKEVPEWTKQLLSSVKVSFLGGSLSETEPTAPDKFGFRKIVIVATENGRLIALDAGKGGRIIWNIKLVDLSPGQKWKIMSIEPKDNVALIQGFEGELWRVHSSNGTLAQYQLGRMSHGSKIAATITDTLGEKLLIPVNDDGFLGNYSKQKIKEGTVIVTRGIQGAVRGWSISSELDPVMAWEFWPALGEVVTKIAMRPDHDPIASIGKVLGDRNVLYKYINPNILLIITANPETLKITMNLLDSVTGHTIHTAVHTNVDTTRAVEAFASENWIAYSLFGEITDPTQKNLETEYSHPRGFQLIVSELYKSQFPNERGSSNIILNISSVHSNPTINRISLPPPYVISQVYSVPGPISLMSITSTLQGITPRSLLCFLPSQNALITVPRAVLDPRRPIGREPSSAELEEGLFKYNPVLEFEPKWVINHKREILSIREIITSPSLLESTTIVFTYGDVDIFGTRVAPIGGFDKLGKGFSKLQLIGTVIALAIGTGIVAPMVSPLNPFILCSEMY